MNSSGDDSPQVRLRSPPLSRASPSPQALTFSRTSVLVDSSTVVWADRQPGPPYSGPHVMGVSRPVGRFCHLAFRDLAALPEMLPDLGFHLSRFLVSFPVFSCSAGTDTELERSRCRDVVDPGDGLVLVVDGWWLRPVEAAAPMAARQARRRGPPRPRRPQQVGGSG